MYTIDLNGWLVGWLVGMMFTTTNSHLEDTTNPFIIPSINSFIYSFIHHEINQSTAKKKGNSVQNGIIYIINNISILYTILAAYRATSAVVCVSGMRKDWIEQTDRQESSQPAD